MIFHPAAQIITWCILIATMQAQSQGALLITASAIIGCAVLLSRRKFLQLVRRTRWIILSLLLIYAYITPGHALLGDLGALSPSVEGLTDGVLQLTRLVAALAGLAVMLEGLSRQQLIAGLYTLFMPLQWLGCSRERLAVRLALTLHYAEAAMTQSKQTWQDSLRDSFHPLGDAEIEKMELPVMRLAISDAFLLGSALLLLWLAIR